MDQMNMNTDQFSDEQQDQLLFMMLIQQHQQIAMMGMGKLKNPSNDKVEREMKSAKFAIDTLVMLQKFTEGNLPRELKNYLNQTLNNLRLNYAEERKKEGEGAGAAPPKGTAGNGASSGNSDAAGNGNASDADGTSGSKGADEEQ